MEDFGNIVYVLAAIGWFLWKTFGKSEEQKSTAEKRRPKPVREIRPEEQPQPSTLQELLEQFGVDKPKEQPVVAKQEARPVRSNLRGTIRSRNKGFLSTDLTHSHLDENYQMSVSEMQGHRVQRQVRVLEVEDVESETLIERLMPNGFNLQNAVVAEAILTRPYK